MTLEDMIQRVQDDTQLNDMGVIINKLNSAVSWIAHRILPMNKEILKVTDDEITLAADTQSYDLAANVSTGTLYQLEMLAVKLTTDTRFIPVNFCSGSSSEFIYWDQQGVQAVQPQFCVIDNFNQVRFAPGVPAGTIIRADYIYKPRKMALNTCTTCDLPEPFHESVCSEAISRAMRGIDDVRAQEYHIQALDEEYGAKNVLGIRQFPQPPRTRPSNRQYRRVY